ncbi:hypothetical protein PC129_g3180 [Phytophthora cactorum]|uniref:Uncharacterized protein n=1 Tax=Phytophthora cactorum TaxID=29920 RepID=A0A8T1IPL3_9STRA|nr:hypothetical protein PC119_g4700 [Phytophthora cactorum]KAG3226211.1 hypothetical protein PC129_g3180 [Phytophthora cactorum]
MFRLLLDAQRLGVFFEDLVFTGVCMCESSKYEVPSAARKTTFFFIFGVFGSGILRVPR